MNVTSILDPSNYDSAVSTINNINPTFALLAGTVGVVALGTLAIAAKIYYAGPTKTLETVEALPPSDQKPALDDEAEVFFPAEAKLEQSEERPSSDVIFETEPSADRPQVESSPELRQAGIFSRDENGALQFIPTRDNSITVKNLFSCSPLAAFLEKTLLKNIDIQSEIVLLEDFPTPEYFEDFTHPVTIFLPNSGESEAAVIRSADGEAFLLYSNQQGILCKKLGDEQAHLLKSNTGAEHLAKYDLAMFKTLGQAIESHLSTSKPQSLTLRKFAQKFFVDPTFGELPGMKQKRYKRDITADDLKRIPYPLTFLTAPNGVELLLVKSKPTEGEKQQIFFLRQDEEGQIWCRVRGSSKAYLVSTADRHNEALIERILDAVQTHVA